MNHAESACLNFLLRSPDAPKNPCFALDEERLAANAALLSSAQEKSGAKILLALKGFAAWAVFPLLSRAACGPLWGTCASSVDEARLGREKFGGEVHAFAAAWSEGEMRELCALADHIIFNSLNQWRRYRPLIAAANGNERKNKPIHCGLRLNPEHSEVATPLYDPCAPGSRLGIRARDLAKAAADDLDGVSGFHFHSLCELGADALERTLQALEKNFSQYLKRCQWLNFGGGHHITRPGYDLGLLCALLREWHKRYDAQIYLEPGEAVALNAGWLSSTVLDIVEADMPVAILDVSAACHMPDVLEMPYTPQAWHIPNSGSGQNLPAKAKEPRADNWTCRLAGKSCLAGDIIGEYSFPAPLAPGQKIVFADMAIYSMVKTTTFNGLRLPAIGVYHSGNSPNAGFELLRVFRYEDFKNRLS